MLVRRKLEISLVNLCDLPQAGLEVLLGLVLHATILDEGSVMVSAILASDPTKLVDITGKVKCASRLKLIPQSSFNFRLEVFESHAVNSVLQPGVLATIEASGYDSPASNLDSKHTPHGFHCHAEPT